MYPDQQKQINPPNMCKQVIASVENGSLELRCTLEDASKILIDQPIVKKLPQITKFPVLRPRLIESTPEWIGVDWWKHQGCCFGTFQLLLFFRTILWQVDTDNSVCCDSCLRDNWGSSSIWRSTVSIFSSVRTLNRALPLNTATFSKCVTIAKIRFESGGQPRQRNGTVITSTFYFV
jgi:hypothetical protein